MFHHVSIFSSSFQSSYAKLKPWEVRFLNALGYLYIELSIQQFVYRYAEDAPVQLKHDALWKIGEGFRACLHYELENRWMDNEARKEVQGAQEEIDPASQEQRYLDFVKLATEILRKSGSIFNFTPYNAPTAQPRAVVKPSTAVPSAIPKGCSRSPVAAPAVPSVCPKGYIPVAAPAAPKPPTPYYLLPWPLRRRFLRTSLQLAGSAAALRPTARQLPSRRPLPRSDRLPLHRWRPYRWLLLLRGHQCPSLLPSCQKWIFSLLMALIGSVMMGPLCRSIVLVTADVNV